MFLVEPVIPGCALLRADPESSSGLDLWIPGSREGARPGMTAFSLKAREFTQLSAAGAALRRAIAQFDGLLSGRSNRKMP
jgi:hypothetical protein